MAVWSCLTQAPAFISRWAAPDLMDEADLILGTVAHPDHRANDPIPGREHFYRRDLNPRRWLRVVLDFNDEPAWVVTALVQQNPPRGWKP
jgi:hypothetical protein